MEGGIRLRFLRDRAGTYYDATAYHGHLIRQTKHHTDIFCRCDSACLASLHFALETEGTLPAGRKRFDYGHAAGMEQ